MNRGGRHTNRQSHHRSGNPCSRVILLGFRSALHQLVVNWSIAANMRKVTQTGERGRIPSDRPYVSLQAFADAMAHIAFLKGQGNGAKPGEIKIKSWNKYIKFAVRQPMRFPDKTSQLVWFGLRVMAASVFIFPPSVFVLLVSACLGGCTAPTRFDLKS